MSKDKEQATEAKAEKEEETKTSSKEKKHSEKKPDLEKQLKEKEEQLLRVAAEYDNFRRRSIKEREETFKNAKVSVISDFLEVLDNFERAASTECDYEAYKQGVQMIFTQFKDILEKLGVEQFGKSGEGFDPEIHNAVMHIEDENFGENEIAEVFQKGYKIGDKVVRHATVKVAN